MSKLPYIVGLLFLLSCSVVSNTFAISWAIAKLLCPGDFPGKNTGVGCHFLLQGIFTTQGLNPCIYCGHLGPKTAKNSWGTMWKGLYKLHLRAKINHSLFL